MAGLSRRLRSAVANRRAHAAGTAGGWRAAPSGGGWPGGRGAPQPLKSFLKASRLAKPKIYLNYQKHKAPPFFFSTADRKRYQPFFAAWDEQAEMTPRVI